MKRPKMDRFLLWVSMGGFLLMSVSFLLMPIEGLQVLPGLLFWGGLLLGIVLQILLELRRRDFFTAYGVKRETMQKPRNGLLTLWSNGAAKIVDCILAVSIAATVLTLVITKGFGYLCYIMIAITLYAFCLHCILNGRIFFHVNNQTKIRQVLEQKKASTLEREREHNEKN